jgi:hypothetical protein
MQTATGITDIWGGGAIGFTSTRFTQPLRVVCQIISERELCLLTFQKILVENKYIQVKITKIASR